MSEEHIVSTPLQAFVHHGGPVVPEPSQWPVWPDDDNPEHTDDNDEPEKS